MREKDVKRCGYPLLVPVAPPLSSAVGASCLFLGRRLFRRPSFFLSFLGGVVVSSSSVVCRSLSPLSCVVWSRPSVVSRLGWCASSRSVLVWVSGSSAPLACRVGRSSPAAVSALVASLRAARASGAPVSLGVRSGWSSSRWFCAVAPASSRALAG